MPLPPKIQKKPELFSGSVLYYQAFSDLNTCRQISSAGEGPITWRDIDYYCLRYNFEPATIEAMHYILAKMDEAYLQFRRH